MTDDNPVAPVTDPVKEAADDTAPPVPVVAPEPPNTTPDWQEPFNNLTNTVTELADKVASILDPKTDDDITDVVEPDESPAKKPWTHRGPFSH